MNRVKEDVKDIDRERLQGQAPRERLTTADVARAASSEPPAQPEQAALTRPRASSAENTPLLAREALDEFKGRWIDIQTGFVDEPRVAVERADELVALAVKRLAESFANEREQLESQWAREGNVSTEDLRLALQRYRAFFERLLHV
jgi:hypothetical protein